ncbi:MAG: DUF4114 domain-containing protein [Leptolyngbyaceae cyanobacterium bins.302]|nr:DUF4114 domain-containing protein [Leptolyngbyaceae cyanobacterium bins.302]
MLSDSLSIQPNSSSATFFPANSGLDANMASVSLLDPNNINIFRSSSFSTTNLPDGIFTVGRSGQVELDYILDGGAFEGELAVFSLSGLNNTLSANDLIQEAARRALSNSELGYVAISDQTEAAKFYGAFPGDRQDWNTGIYQGIKTLNLRPGDQFGLMLVPNGTVQEVLSDPSKLGDRRPLLSFSLDSANPTQFADLSGDDSLFAFEDLDLKTGSDRDYNDLSFQIIGATGTAATLDGLKIKHHQDWQKTSLGKEIQDYIETRLLQETISLQDISSGVFTVDATGQVGIDYLFDGGAYNGQLAIFSLEGLDQKDWKVVDFIQEAARRALSDSELGHVVIADRDEGARFSGKLPWEADFNEGIYGGVKTFSMKAGSQFGVMLVPNATVQEVLNEPTSRGSVRPLFSIASANPRDGFHLGQIADLTGNGNTFTMEDLRFDKGSDRDYNDIVFQVRGAIGQADLLDQYIDHQKDWRTSNLGQTLIEYTRPYVLPDNPKVGETVPPNLLEILVDASGLVEPTSGNTASTAINPLIQPVIDNWLSNANSQLSSLLVEGSQVGNDLTIELTHLEGYLDGQIDSLQSSLIADGDYMNAWKNYLSGEIVTNTDYMNAWTVYLNNEISGVGDSLYSQVYDLWSSLSSNGNYLNAWVNYLGSQITRVDNASYEKVGDLYNSISNNANTMNAWQDWLADQISSDANYSNAWLDWMWNSFNNNNVDATAWGYYNAIADKAIANIDYAWDDYSNLNSYINETIRSAWNEYDAISNYVQSVVSNGWSNYAVIDEYVDAVTANAWSQYRALNDERSYILNNAYAEFDWLMSYRDAIVTNAWSEHNALQNYIDWTLDNAWDQFYDLYYQKYELLANAQKQESILLNAWDDQIADIQALQSVWTKIATNEHRWYETTLTDQMSKTGLPLIGLIDTGFRLQEADIHPARVILGQDWVDQDSNPLLHPQEWWQSNHGTQTLEIIGATRNNGVGMDGINDLSPLWLGRAIDSNDWAQSLVEFVDFVKTSDQPNAVINLSFDLTQTNLDGSVTTRYQLTALERAALTYAQQNNVLIVTTTGNQADTMSALGQATREFDNVMTVGAAEDWQQATYSSQLTTPEQAAFTYADRHHETVDPDAIDPEKLDYSNYGKGVDIVAQGSASNGAEGTSVAAAKVTGAVSLLWAANPGLNYTQVVDLLKRTATDLQTPGWDAETGAGLLNISAAVNLAQATLAQNYRPANLDAIQDTLAINGIPQADWKSFYEFSYYNDLEAKVTGNRWNQAGAIASERPTGFWDDVGDAISDGADYVSDNWDWENAGKGAAIGAIFGGGAGATLGAIIGGLTGGSGNSGLSDFARNVVVSAAKEIKNATDRVANAVDDAADAAVSAATTVNNAVNQTVSDVVAGANAINDAVDATVNNVVDTANTIGNTLAATTDAVTSLASYVSDRVQDTQTAILETARQIDSILGQTRNAINETANLVGDRLAQTADAMTNAADYVNDRFQAGANYLNDKYKQYEDELMWINPIGGITKTLAEGLINTVKEGDPAAAIDVLKRVPVLGTAVGGLEGLYYAAKGDWQEVLKSAIDSALAFYGASNVVTPRLVSLFVDVSWELKDENYKGAISAALSNFGVQRQVADVFVNSAWAMKDGDWQGVLDAGLSGAGFNNARQFVDMAWGAIDNKPADVLNAAFGVAGLDKLGVDQAKSNAFVQSALALKDNKVNQVADQLLSVAGSQAGQLASSTWVRALRDSDPNNDRAALTQGLSAVGFQNVTDWVNMAWAVKDQNYLQAASTAFSLSGFAQGRDWVSMADNLQKENYLGALSTGFKVAGFAKGENLAKAAISLRQGDPLTAFFEGLSLVDGVGELVDAFKALKDGNAKAGVPLMIQAAPKLAVLIGT